MTFQFSPALRNNQANQLQTTVAASGTGSMQLRMYTGSEPADTTVAATGTLLVSIALPATFMTTSSGATPAAGGSVSLSGTWAGTASATGTAAYFRIYDSAGTPVCHVQGTVGMSGTDMIINNNSIATGQSVSVTSFTVSMGNA